MNETQKTIAAYRAEQQRRQKIGDIAAAAFVIVLSVPTLAAIAYALIN